MQFTYAPELGIDAAVTAEDLAARIRALEDILIVDRSAGGFIQARKEATGFLVEYQHAGVQYECTPELVTEDQAVRAFIAYTEHGAESHEFQSSLDWTMCKSYQPGGENKAHIPKDGGEYDFSEEQCLANYDKNWRQSGIPYETVRAWDLAACEERKAIAKSASSAEPAPTPEHTNGIEFEEFVARTLQSSDWIVRLTKKSGDQGLDLLARDDKYRVAIQCKRYSSPVGNSAVQEVHAAADFSGSTHAVVVATAGFTIGAIELAQALEVILLAESDLADLRSHLVFASPRQPRKGVPSIFR